MNAERKKKWSVGIIGFLLLYCLVILQVIVNIFKYQEASSVYNKFNAEIPAITIFFTQYGLIISVCVVLFTLIPLIKEFIQQKIITFKSSVTAFIIMLIWSTFFRWAYFLPSLRISNIGR